MTRLAERTPARQIPAAQLALRGFHKTRSSGDKISKHVGCSSVSASRPPRILVRPFRGCCDGYCSRRHLPAPTLLELYSSWLHWCPRSTDFELRFQVAQLTFFVDDEVNHLFVLNTSGLSNREPNAHGILGRLAPGEHDDFDSMKSRGALSNARC